MICFVHIGIWFNLFLLPLLIFFFFHKEKTDPHPLSMWSSCVFMWSLPVKHATGRGFLTVPAAIRFCFHCHFYSSGTLHILSLLSSLLHSLHRAGKGQCRQDFIFLPFLCALLPKELSSSRSCVTEGKKIQLSPHLPSILHTVDQSDSASLKVIVAGLIPLGWMCMVCTFLPTSGT